MTATNHAVTGAIIGLSIANPWLAIPLAFLSHFALDAIPHFDPPGITDVDKMQHRRFVPVMLVGGAVTCFILVALLITTRPHQWLTAAICAFAAASPDLFWIPRYLHVLKTGRDKQLKNPFLLFHVKVQWLTGPKFWPVEALWLLAAVAVLAYIW